MLKNIKLQWNFLDCVRHHRAVVRIAERSLRRYQYQGKFIVALPTENNNILGLKCSLEQISKFVHSTVANSSM
jgi:hypothetical protein